MMFFKLILYVIAFTGVCTLPAVSSRAEIFCIKDSSEVAAKVSKIAQFFQVNQPIAVAELGSSQRFAGIAKEVKNMIFNTLQKLLVPVVEGDVDVLDQVLARLESQSTLLIDQKTVVKLGHWTAPKFLLIVSIEENHGERKARCALRVINLENRKQHAAESFDFNVQSCWELDLPPPSRGGVVSLPSFEMRN